MNDRRFQIEHQEQYGGEFVALQDGRVLAHAKTVGDLFQMLEAMKLDPASVVFAHIEPSETICVYRIPAR